MKSRKSIRLNAYDYTRVGSYFITACVLKHHCCFGYINDEKMIYNQYGNIAVEQFIWLSEYYSYVDVKIFTVMPNHVHAIIDIKSEKSGQSRLSLSQLIGAYKTRVSASIHKLGFTEFAWQRSFYDHIIRNNYSYENIAEYIKSNPSNWSKDRFHKNNPPDSHV